MKTNYREMIDDTIRVINKEYKIDMLSDKDEVSVYARIYLAKKLAFINMSNKYIAAIYKCNITTINKMLSLKGYNKEKYIQYRDNFKAIELKDKERKFNYEPIINDLYNENFFKEKEEAIQKAINNFRYTFEKCDKRIMTTNKLITVAFRMCNKLHICLSMTYNGKTYNREYRYTKLGIETVY